MQHLVVVPHTVCTHIVVVVLVVVVVVVVRRAYIRRHNYKVTSAPPSRLSLKKTEMSSVTDGIRQAQCLAAADLEVSCSIGGPKSWGPRLWDGARLIP